MNSKKSPLLLALAGPAGSGKTTLCNRIAQEIPNFSRVVTATTRAPRKGEIDGMDYWFLSPYEFRKKADDGEFLERAHVHGHHENRRYGTFMKSVIMPLNRGCNLVMNVDVQGIKNFKETAKIYRWLQCALTTVFIRVSPEELAARMHKRKQDHPEEIARRLQTADAELREAQIFDFVIESGTPEEDFAALLEIIRLRSEMSAA